MGLFKKKKAPEPEPIKIKTPCEMFGHLWQDFPWIIEDKYDRDDSYYMSRIEIKEYYVCRICHEIKKVTIGTYCDNCKRSEHNEKVARLKQEYAEQIKPIPVVQDMIQDMIHVDEERLKIWENLHKGE